MSNLHGRMATKLGRETKVEIKYADPLNDYRIADRDTGNGAYNYFGYLKTDGSYYIMREEVSIGAYRYTRGTGSYPSVWTNRAGQSYDYLNVVFG